MNNIMSKELFQKYTAGQTEYGGRMWDQKG